MDFFLYILIAFFALSLLVFFHELGHYLVAKLFGVHVDRFSIGFGKILARKRCCNTEWAFSAIPLGGYITMKGQDDINPNLADKSSDSYSSKKPWQRILILLAGPMANFILAFIVYWALAVSSAPAVIAKDYMSPTIVNVSADSPASKAGLKAGDIITSIDSHPVEFWYQIGDIISQSSSDMNFSIKRDRETLTMLVSAKFIDTKNNFNEPIKRRIVGINTQIKSDKIIHFTPMQSIHYAWHETIKGSKLITKSVKKVSTGEVSPKEIGGAISIFDIIAKYTQKGIPYLLYIMAIISINLGVMNLLPIPALDGGHVVINLYEIIFRRPPGSAVIQFLTIAGWLILLGLMSLGLYNDINRLWE